MRACLFVLLLCGCAQLVAIDYSTAPPADWPRLDERLTYADLETVQRWCNMPAAVRARGAKGCAVVSFQYDLCMIYLSDRSESLLQHERAHCAGYGHVGSAGEKARVAWERWKANGTVELLTQ